MRSESRALKLVAVAAAAAPSGVIHAKASESGHTGRTRQSERERAPEAKLQQPASRERSNNEFHVCTQGASGLAPCVFFGFFCPLHTVHHYEIRFPLLQRMNRARMFPNPVAVM